MGIIMKNKRDLKLVNSPFSVYQIRLEVFNLLANVDVFIRRDVPDIQKIKFENL